MKPFRFTLEAVRTLRQRQEQRAMEQYAQALVTRQQAVDLVASIQSELDEGWQDLRSEFARGCTASNAAHAHDHHRVLARRRDEAVTALGVAERRVNAALQSMLTARQQREIVDKSCEKQKAAHARELSRAEQKVLDDLASRRPSVQFQGTQTEALP